MYLEIQEKPSFLASKVFNHFSGSKINLEKKIKMYLYKSHRKEDFGGGLC